MEDALPRLGRHRERVEKRAVQRGVPEADAVVAQPGGVERAAQDAERLGRALGRRRADQLDARLQEFAGLAALRSHAAVGVREVAEPQGRL